MQSIIDHYQRDGIEALKRVDLMNLPNDLYYELLFAVMRNDDTESFSCLPSDFSIHKHLQKVLQISHQLSTTKFVQLLIEKSTFITTKVRYGLFEVVERGDCFSVEDVCTILLAYQELGLLPRIEQLHSQEEKVIEALKRMCDV